VPLNLAACGLGNAGVSYQNNVVRIYIVYFHNRLANVTDDLPQWSIGVLSIQFLNDHQTFLIQYIDAEGSAASLAQRGVCLLDRRFDVLWIVVSTANDD